MPDKKLNYYFEALKKWNAESGNKFCIPKKYTKEYDEIMKIKKEMQEKDKKKE